MKRVISEPFQTKEYDFLGNFHVTTVLALMSFCG